MLSEESAKPRTGEHKIQAGKGIQCIVENSEHRKSGRQIEMERHRDLKQWWRKKH